MAICSILACALAVSTRATTITVTNTNDSGPGSLRQALAIATDGDTIDATGISGVITLTAGVLIVNKSVTINGPGAEILAIDGNAASTVFQVMSMAPVTISGVTIRNGHGNFGGGILNNGPAELTLMNSTLSGNAGGFGGAIYNGGALTILNSTLSGNMAGSDGAGVYNATTLTITNSTFSGNTAHGSGGGCLNGGMLLIANSTVSGNSAGFAGGVYNIGTLNIGNTVLKRGDSGANLTVSSGGTVTSRGYNLSSDDAAGFLNGPGDQINIDPLLGPLQDNGGPTFTHALLPGSPAIDAGDPNFTPPPFFDQRGPGFERVVNGRIDKGSFEVQAPTVQSASSLKTHGAAGTFDIPLPLTGSVGVECRTTGGTNDYTMVVTFSGNVTVTGSPQAQVTSGTGCIGAAGVCSGSVSVSGAVVTVPLTNIANAQVINVRINGVNSAADAPAVDVNIPMGILIGDTNANRSVNAGDIAQTKARLGQAVDGTDFRSDVNVNGSINGADVAIIKGHSGTSIP